MGSCPRSLSMTKAKCKAKAEFTVVRNSGDEADTSIPQARTVRISENGLRILQTPRSPQKRSTTIQVSPDFGEWNPSVDYASIGWSGDQLGELFQQREGEETSDPMETVAAKVAAKRYPTSISFSLRCPPFTINRPV